MIYTTQRVGKVAPVAWEFRYPAPLDYNVRPRIALDEPLSTFPKPHQTNMPSIQVALLPELVSPEDYRAADLAVVIDTLRFTTSAVAALQAGAVDISTCKEIATARAIAASDPDRLLCGERHCRPIDGFHLGNSPLEYTEQAVTKKRLLFTTTNGTRAVAAAQLAPKTVLASLTNRRSVTALMQRQPEDGRIVIVCAGTDGHIAMEDVLTAGALIDGSGPAGEQPELVLCGDSAFIAQSTWRQVYRPTFTSTSCDIAAEIVAVFRNCLGGRSLVNQGYLRDLSVAAQLDSKTAIPMTIRADVGRATEDVVSFRLS